MINRALVTCALCHKDTDLPCGPKEHEVCPSCWLAVGGDDFLCGAPDLETAVEWIRDKKDINNILEMTEPDMSLRP